MPPPLTVMVAVLATVVVFAAYDTVRLPLLLPLAGVTVHHVVALEDAVQLVLEVTPTVLFPAADVTVAVAPLNINSGVLPLWVNAYVRLMPPPVTVMVAVLATVVVFAAYDTVRLPLLLPLDGVTVHHVVELEVAVQLILDVTPTVLLPAADVTVAVAALNVNSGVLPLWVNT
jgi:hypothetical protein